MKSKIFNLIVIILSLFVLVEILIKKALIYESIHYALSIWVNSLIPSLFPFFIISDILINYNITLYIPKIIKKFVKYLFNITDNMMTILFLSIISGFPSNARNTRTLYDKELISLDEANHILMFSHFSNPLFILTTVSIFFFNDNDIGWILLLSHYLSNFLVGIMFRNKFDHSNKTINVDNIQNSFGNIFIGSIKKSIDTILLICGIVCVFLVLSSLISNIFNFNLYNSMIIKGIFEITIGIEALSKIPLSMVYKGVIASCFLSFGGLSVHMQVMSQITDTDISYGHFFVGRLYQTLFSGFITFILCILWY